MEKSAQKDASQPNETNKGQKPDEAGSSMKDAQGSKIQSEESNKNETGKSDSAQASDKTSPPGIV